MTRRLFAVAMATALAFSALGCDSTLKRWCGPLTTAITYTDTYAVPALATASQLGLLPDYYPATLATYTALRGRLVSLCVDAASRDLKAEDIAPMVAESTVVIERMVALYRDVQSHADMPTERATAPDPSGMLADLARIRAEATRAASR